MVPAAVSCAREVLNDVKAEGSRTNMGSATRLRTLRSETGVQ